MLRREHRLGRAEVEDVLQNGTSHHRAHLSLKGRSTRAEQTPRFAVVVPSTVTRSAVARSKLRRRVYSILQEMLPQILPYHGVVFCKRGADVIPAAALRQELIQLLRRARTLSSPC